MIGGAVKKLMYTVVVYIGGGVYIYMYVYVLSASVHCMHSSIHACTCIK